jgi:FKBP-type peptidyl-prolyl cis-trans isomerase FkpA
MKRFFPFLCAALLLIPACGGSPTDPSQVTGVSFTQTDLVVGSGKVVAVGNTISTNYTLWLYNANGPDKKGAQIQAGQYSFVVGAFPPQAIAGFDQGVVGMAVGGKRRIIIPPSLGYGAAGGGGGQIPPNANLVFEVELLGVT